MAAMDANRKRKATKRALCPYINSQIMSSAQSGNIHVLLSTISQYKQDMNLVNQTTSMHRLAKLASESAMACEVLGRDENQRLVYELLEDCGLSLSRSENGMPASRTQAVSNLLWSLGILGCVNLDVINITVNLACNKVGSFKPFDLASTARAYAKLGQSEPSIESLSLPFFQVAVKHLIAAADEMSAGPLTMVIWAYARVKVLDQDLFDAVAARLLSLLPVTDLMPQQLLDITFAFSEVGIRNEPVLMAIAAQVHRRIGSAFPSTELVELTHLLALEGVYCWDFYVFISDRVGLAGVHSDAVAKVIAALASAQRFHGMLQASILKLLGSWGPLIASTAEASVLALLLNSLGIRYGSPGGGSQQESTGVPPVVSQFLQTCTASMESRHQPLDGDTTVALLKAMLSTATPVPQDFSNHVADLVQTLSRSPAGGNPPPFCSPMLPHANERSSNHKAAHYEQHADEPSVCKTRTDASTVDFAPPGLFTKWSPTASTSSLASDGNLPTIAPLAKSPIFLPPTSPAPSFFDLASKPSSREETFDPTLVYRSDFAMTPGANLFRDAFLDEGYSSRLQRVSVDKWFEDVEPGHSGHGDAMSEITMHRVSYAF